MERSPRSAAVPRAAASMSQCHTLRSFVISLVIAIAITNSPASGFTIARDLITPDLETGESKQLEVKYDLKTLNNNEKTYNNTKEDLNSTVLAINNTNINKQNDSDDKVTEKQQLVNESTDTQTSENSKTEIQFDTTIIISTTTASNAFDTTAPSTSPTTKAAYNTSSTSQTTKTTSDASNTTVSSTNQFIETASDASVSTLSETIRPETAESQATSTTSSVQPSLTTKSTENSTVTNKIETTETITAEDQNNNVDTTTIATADTTTIATANTNNSNSVNNNDTVKSENNTNDLRSNSAEDTVKSENNTNDLRSNSAEDTVQSENNTNYFSTPNQPEATTNNLMHTAITTVDDSESKVTTQTAFTDQKVDQTNAKEESMLAKTDGQLDTYTTSSSESKTDVTSENFTGEVYTIDFDVSKLPSWKKYTMIDRKRTSAEDTTTATTEKEMARAETAQTRISLENVFTNTPIPSLEKLKDDLINAQESTTRQIVTTTSTGIETTLSNGSNPETNITASTSKIVTETDTEPMKLEIVSKRAGYKDNRGTDPPKPEEATTTQFSPRVSSDQTDVFSTINMYESEPSEVEVSRNKNGSVYESQSQLAEDAIKEELLKESMLNDHEQNAKLKQERTEGVLETVTVDTLSVKPIGQEKKKNTILYAVSPNYKPLKKIDVQPLKPFVRDPDDNSWRNESISSLGIVFKPKNASKSFTQVLKNKTEIELGNMTDKDSKEDLPDLRVRLEKIAEVRKSKKKINKFGDTVYGDYEESSENTNPSRIDTTTPMSPTVETTISPPTTLSSTTDFDLTVNAISKEHFDLFKTDISSQFTTNAYKPKKFYNMAEYYDATDEYDADYVNQHKIDLKKFTKPMKIKEDIATQPPELLRTQPPELLHTQPMTEYQPERKATLQYFPPTQKVVQKVNMNDYDTSFNRKVNLYDVNRAPPKNVLAASFGTVAPIPTERYDPLNKVSMKPAYTPMYQPENLNKNLYLTNQPQFSEPPPNDGAFNRASYVIKHYRDFISEAAQDGEDERSEEYAYTEPPLRGVTVNELAKVSPRDSNQAEEEYEYDVKFRKDIMNRFVDNFNQNSERFKVDFPVLYNSSVVHRPPELGRVASSTAFMKRLYEVGQPRASNFVRRPCEPHCDKTVELSPAYELHYYVPDEEEKEEQQPRAHTPPLRYRL